MSFIAESKFLRNFDSSRLNLKVCKELSARVFLSVKQSLSLVLILLCVLAFTILRNAVASEFVRPADYWSSDMHIELAAGGLDKPGRVRDVELRPR